MIQNKKVTRRQFIKGVTATGTLVYLGGLHGVKDAFSNSNRSQVYCAGECPVHDGQLRHAGLDVLLDLLAENGTQLYRTVKKHPWGSIQGIIASHDVVLIKVNCQWKCRGTTNTDVLRGLIYRILQHPDGFDGEIVIFENGQGQGSFNGNPNAWGSYAAWPAIDHGIYVNAEAQTTLTIDYLVQSTFSGEPVSNYLLDPIRSNFISATDHVNDGYRRISDVSYPCFTTEGGHRIELREGIWTGSNFEQNLKLINLPVLKHHAGTGITGALKNTYGILSMNDGYSTIRHYSQCGTQCGKMMTTVRPPDLNIMDCIWVSHECLRGYPPACTYRVNKLLASIDPVALDYYASKYVLFPIGGSKAAEHHPDAFAGLINHLGGARDFINNNGGIAGHPATTGDENITVIYANAKRNKKPMPWIPLLLLDD